MSLMDRIKSFFSGSSAVDEREHGSPYLQTPSHPDEPVLEPTPEEIAAAARAEPPTTTVDALSEEEPRQEPRDEVH